MLCINCRNEVGTGAIVCPYCHTNPIIFGSAPYQGIPIDYSGGGLLGWFVSWFRGDGKRKVAKDETESTIVPFHNQERRKCKKCNHLTLVEARYCQGCKRTFVD